MRSHLRIQMVTRPRLRSRFAIRPPKKRFPKALQPPHFPFPISLNSLSAPPSPLSFPSRSIALNTSHKNISVIRFGQRSIRSAFCKIIKALPLRPIVILSSFSVVLHLQFPQDLIDLIWSVCHIRSTWHESSLWSMSSFLFCSFVFPSSGFPFT